MLRLPGALDRGGNWVCGPQIGLGEGRDVQISVTIFVKFSHQRLFLRFFGEIQRSLNYAVIGTPNRLEYDQGFFVKLGDGAADIKPIAHLYKTQVYQMAHFLGVPYEIRKRTPITDTYSMPQTQEEFFFSLPYDQMDLCLYGKNNGIAYSDVAAAAGLTVEQVERVYQDIEVKRNSTHYLHMPAILVNKVDEISF